MELSAKVEQAGWLVQRQSPASKAVETARNRDGDGELIQTRRASRATGEAKKKRGKECGRDKARPAKALGVASRLESIKPQVECFVLELPPSQPNQ